MSSQFPDYPANPNMPQKPKGSLTWLWIVLGVLGGVSLLGCVCCGGLSWFGVSAGGKILAQPYVAHPVVVDKLGGIDSASMNFSAMGQEAKNGNDKTMVLDVKGPKGSGQLILSGQRPQGDFANAKLRMGAEEWDLGGPGIDPPVVEQEMPPEPQPVNPPGEAGAASEDAAAPASNP